MLTEGKREAAFSPTPPGSRPSPGLSRTRRVPPVEAGESSVSDLGAWKDYALAERVKDIVGVRRTIPREEMAKSHNAEPVKQASQKIGPGRSCPARPRRLPPVIG